MTRARLKFSITTDFFLSFFFARGTTAKVGKWISTCLLGMPGWQAPVGLLELVFTAYEAVGLAPLDLTFKRCNLNI